MTKDEARRLSAQTVTPGDIMIANEQMLRATQHKDDCMRAMKAAEDAWLKARTELNRRIKQDYDNELIESGVKHCATLETAMHDAAHKLRKALRAETNALFALGCMEGTQHPGAPVKPKRNWFKRAMGRVHKDLCTPFTGYQLVVWHMLWVTLTLLAFQLIGALG